MDFQIIKLFFRTKVFKLLIILGIAYFSGFFIYNTYIQYNADELNWFTSIIYLIYWRWYLDWSIIFGILLFFSIIVIILVILQKFIKNETLQTYIFPVIIMGANIFGMIAIDVAITVFADVYIAGNWESTEIWWLGLTAQKIYHGFFFWYMPFLIIMGVPLMHMISIKKDEGRKYLRTFKTLFVCIAIYSFTLGILDPIVCQIIWDNWAIFGEWNMMGYGWIWAEGWIIHYIIFGMLWIFAVFLTEKSYKEIIYLKTRK